MGTIQGLTEFLPISSSGHLVIAQKLLPGFNQPGILFDVVLHLGTTLAVLIFYYKRIIEILKNNWKYIWLLIVATIPAVIVGVFFGDYLENSFSDIKAVGVQFLVTGVICILVDKFNSKKDTITSKGVVLMGIAQAVAILPAISRSGATILVGSMLGVDKKKVAEFSFLMSVPAIIGANVWQFVKHGSVIEGEVINYLLGFIAAFVFGYLSIKLVLTSLHERKFKYFGIYCFALGVIVFLFVG